MLDLDAIGIQIVLSGKPPCDTDQPVKEILTQSEGVGKDGSTSSGN